VLYADLQHYFKERIENKFPIHNACFYDSDLLGGLIGEISINDAKEMTDIVARIIAQAKEKDQTREHKKYAKKEEQERSSLGDTRVLGEEIGN
jgi:hypothetical protein